MNNPLLESLNIFSKICFNDVMTLSPSSIEGLMGLREEQPSSLLSFKGPELSGESPPSNGSGSLSRSTAPQMRDVIPNRWWE